MVCKTYSLSSSHFDLFEDEIVSGMFDLSADVFFKRVVRKLETVSGCDVALVNQF